MTKSCTQCSAEFEVTEADMEFYERVDVPVPTFCPLCRFQRRCAFINVRNFYPHYIKAEQQSRMSMYSDDLDVHIVADEQWWSDAYDLMSYGADYDFTQPFFAQFASFMKRVPLPHLQRAYSTFENSDFCNAAAGLKNCYLVTNADDCEDCMYGYYIELVKDSLDVIFCNKSELCYESMHLASCMNCMFCEDCESCSNAVYCKDCVNCNDCFGCIGLRHKRYHIYNKEYSKNEYSAMMSQINTRSYKSLCLVQQEVSKVFNAFPHKFYHGRNNEDVDGDYIYDSKDVHESYLVMNAEKCKYAHLLQVLSTGTHDAHDYTMFGVGADLVYDTAWCGLGIHNIKFSLWNYGASNLEYCIGCHYSSNLFGCIGLRHKKYCILNKQFSKEEYEARVHEIKAHMSKQPYVDAKGISHEYGEFFPIELSPFHYNQTLAQDYVPLQKSEAIANGYGWYERQHRDIENILSWEEIPDSIEEVDSDILSKNIVCKAFADNPDQALQHNCTQYFRITAKELEFYRKLGICMPRYCFNSRHFLKLKKINPFHLWSRTCAKCSKSIQTTYAPDRPEIVYCEECYLKEVY